MPFFCIRDGDGDPVSGGSPSFLSAFDAETLAAASVPAITEHSAGVYSFSSAVDVTGMIDCGADAVPRYRFVAPRLGNTFPVYDADGAPATGLSPTMTRATIAAGTALTALTISELGHGVYGYPAPTPAEPEVVDIATTGELPERYCITVPAASASAFASSLLAKVENSVVSMLQPLLLPTLGGEAGGYLQAVKLYQGDLTPLPDDEELQRVLSGQSPAVLVSSADTAEYGEISVSHDTGVERAQIVLLIVATNYRSRAAQARGDGISTDPGAYEILNQVRARLQGRDSNVNGAGRFIPIERAIVHRGEARAIHSLTLGIELDALPYEPPIDTYDTLRMNVNRPGGGAENPVVQGDRSLI